MTDTSLRLIDPVALPRPVLVSLTDQGVIRASGPEAHDFLQNLLTNDVKTLSSDELRLAGFCTPKGRLLALFHLWADAAHPGDILLMLPREILPAMLKKLSMYVLRSKVKLTDASDELNLWGWAASTGAVSPALTFAGGQPVSQTLRLNRTDGPALGVIATPAMPTQPAIDGVDVADLTTWHWLEIIAGVPRILAATQEAFVPQMLNMELQAVAGISFTKGCYPGQEIVARTQYLGKIKRRMYRTRLAEPAAPGTQVFAPDTGDQPCGMVVSSATAPAGHSEALVCVQSAAVEAGPVHVGSPTGPLLQVLALPYELDGPDTRGR